MSLNQAELRARISFNLRRSFDVALIRRCRGAARAGHGVGKAWDFVAPALLTRLATASDEERTLRERVYQSLRQPDGTGRMPLLNEGVDPNAPEQAIGSHPTIPQDPAHLWPLCERYDLSGE